jgi:hypothetical protein
VIGFVSVLKENGKRCMCINPNTLAFKKYVCANGIKQHGGAWIKNGLIIPMQDGKRELATRSFTSPLGVKARYLAFLMDDNEDSKNESEYE